QSLFAAREQRVRPGCDSKRLAGWNGMMIAGMAHASRLLGRDDWLSSARRAFAFVRTRLWHNGRLHATSDGGPGRLNAYLDDHACLLDAALELLQCEFDAEVLAFAEELADALLDDFEDRGHGGFCLTRHDHEALIARPKPLHDNATASGNGVAARMLARLGHLTGERRYLDAAERAVLAAWPLLARNPLGCASLALALQAQIEPPGIVVINGPVDALRPLQECVRTRYLPHFIGLVVSDRTDELAPALVRGETGPAAVARVCRGRQCLPPISDTETLTKVLESKG